MRLAVALVLSCATVASAGLRPQYGGEIVIIASSAPRTTEPARAWTPAELVLANALGAPLSAFTGPATSSADGRQLRLPLREGATWPDGTPVDAVELARALELALRTSAVALPPWRFKVEQGALMAETPYPPRDGAATLALPWLRLVRKGAGGAFRVSGADVEADTNGLGGRALLDHLRFEPKEGRRLEAPAEGVLLARGGAEGRPVFALPRKGGPAAAVLAAELPGVNRENLARLFLRGYASVPEDWPLPAAAPRTAAPEAPLVIAIDKSEGDLRTVGERVQVLLRDRKVASRLVAEDREAHFARLATGDWDLALVALPTAPALVQAATLARLAGGPDASDAVWKEAATAKDRSDRDLLREAARRAGALLLYMEGGAVLPGARVRGFQSAHPWLLDPSSAWLAPIGAGL